MSIDTDERFVLCAIQSGGRVRLSRMADRQSLLVLAESGVEASVDLDDLLALAHEGGHGLFGTHVDGVALGAMRARLDGRHVRLRTVDGRNRVVVSGLDDAWLDLWSVIAWSVSPDGRATRREFDRAAAAEPTVRVELVLDSDTLARARTLTNDLSGTVSRLLAAFVEGEADGTARSAEPR